MKALEGKGKAGDWYALVLSGHGGITRQQWIFLTQDNRDLADEAILGFADRLAAGGKKVMIIIDACHAGQLRYAANAVLNRYAEGSKGGIILMVSSMPSQTSAALGAYSAFARAVEEGIREWSSIHDLADIVAGRETGRATPDDVTLFKSVGLAIEDVAMAAEIVKRAREAGLGTALPY